MNAAAITAYKVDRTKAVADMAMKDYVAELQQIVSEGAPVSK